MDIKSLALTLEEQFYMNNHGGTIFSWLCGSQTINVALFVTEYPPMGRLWCRVHDMYYMLLIIAVTLMMTMTVMMLMMMTVAVMMIT